MNQNINKNKNKNKDKSNNMKNMNKNMNKNKKEERKYEQEQTNIMNKNKTNRTLNTPVKGPAYLTQPRSGARSVEVIILCEGETLRH